MENDPCKFVLSCRGSSERFTLQAANTDIKQVWVQHISELLDAQSNFLSGERSPTFQLRCLNHVTLHVHLLGAVRKVRCLVGIGGKPLSDHYLWIISALFASFAFISPLSLGIH